MASTTKKHKMITFDKQRGKNLDFSLTFYCRNNAYDVNSNFVGTRPDLNRKLSYVYLIACRG